MFYKTLAPNGASGLGKPDAFHHSLPAAGQPGPWVTIAGALTINKGVWDGDNGIHIASRKWLVRYLCDEVYEAEYQGDYLKDGRFMVARQVRLIRRLPGWTARTARLFAADCAAHVLDFYQRRYPGDTRPLVAIQTARNLAEGNLAVDSPEALEAFNEAFAAYEEAENHTPAKSSAGAAFNCLNLDQSAASAAREAAQSALAAIKLKAKDWAALSMRRNRRREMNWQTDRLFRILYGPLPNGY